jgi:hypothetical protein
VHLLTKYDDDCIDVGRVIQLIAMPSASIVSKSATWGTTLSSYDMTGIGITEISYLQKSAEARG